MVYIVVCYLMTTVKLKSGRFTGQQSTAHHDNNYCLLNLHCFHLNNYHNKKIHFLK